MDRSEQPTLKEILAKIQQIDRLNDLITQQIATGTPRGNTLILTKQMQALSQEVQTTLQVANPQDEDYAAMQAAVKAMHKKLFGQN